MNPKTWPRWSELSSALSTLREHVVVDCGHLAVRHLRGQFCFGGAAGPSPTELSSFVQGVELSRHLRAQGRQVTLNVCLSDTSRLLRSKAKKEELRAAVDERRFETCLPQEYSEHLTPAELDDLVVMLQTRNSNRFSALMKKAKAKAVAADSPEALYGQLGAALLRSLDGERFAVTSPILLQEAERHGEGAHQQWVEESLSLREEDRAPLEKLREAAVITLYQKGVGPLCPATYGGLLLHYDERYDHVCLYGRADDRHITEKILRGVLATNSLKQDFSRTCLQIVTPEFSEVPELSIVHAPRLRRERPPWTQVLESMRARQVFDTMEFYGSSAEVQR